jgi:uncharacterized protein (DUF983 family)
MKNNYLLSILNNRCPRCREGKLFAKSNPYVFSETTHMNEKCPVCGQPTEIEVGFYIGTGYVSYGLTVGFSLLTFAIWVYVTGYTLQNKEIFWWLPVNIFFLILLQPWIMRLSRIIWLTAFFHSDDEFFD